jgi:hypothetical protein
MRHQLTFAHVIEVLDRRGDAERLRRQHPVLHVHSPVWEATAQGGRWTWTVGLQAGPTFVSSLELEVGEAMAGVPPDGLGAVLALIDALSYWKAAVPERLVFDSPLPGGPEWWDGFVANSMGEHLWRNGLDLDWLPTLEGEFTDKPIASPDRASNPELTMLLHSGGKDSITAAHLAHRAGRAVRPISYQPTSTMRRVVERSAPAEGWAGSPVTMTRRLDPALLDLNAAGYLNGHTPYSAWLAVAASAAADLCGIAHVAAGNSRSDDEPNITAELPSGGTWHINHQWTKSAAFESAWADVIGPDRRYASPLRPLYEIAVLAGLHADPLPETRQALSCNRAAKEGRDGSWCGRCPKCLWTAAALDAIAGPGAGATRLGADPLASPANAVLLKAMCGRSGPVPFECAGIPAEVRAVLREIAQRPSPPAAVDALDPSDIEARSHDDASLPELVSDQGPAPLLEPSELTVAATWSTSAHLNLYPSTPVTG